MICLFVSLVLICTPAFSEMYYKLQQEERPVKTIILGMQERSRALGHYQDAISKLNIIEEWTDGSFVAVTTNLTDSTTVNGVNIRSVITTNMFRQLDDILMDITKYYVDTRYESNGSYSNWFSRTITTTNEHGKVYTNHPRSFPMLTPVSIFMQQGIGWVDESSIHSNEWGVITNGNCGFTRLPKTEERWVISEISGTNINNIDPYGSAEQYAHHYGRSYMTEDIKPYAVLLNGSNATVTIYGRQCVIWPTPLTLTYGTRAITVTDTPIQLEDRWFDIEVVSGDIPENATIVIYYKGAEQYNMPREVGYYDNPYRLYKKMIEERVKYMELLKQTANSSQYQGWMNTEHAYTNITEYTNVVQGGSFDTEDKYEWDGWKPPWSAVGDSNVIAQIRWDWDSCFNPNLSNPWTGLLIETNSDWSMHEIQQPPYYRQEWSIGLNVDYKNFYREPISNIVENPPNADKYVVETNPDPILGNFGHEANAFSAWSNTMAQAFKSDYYVANISTHVKHETDLYGFEINNSLSNKCYIIERISTNQSSFNKSEQIYIQADLPNTEADDSRYCNFYNNIEEWTPLASAWKETTNSCEYSSMVHDKTISNSVEVSYNEARVFGELTVSGFEASTNTPYHDFANLINGTYEIQRYNGEDDYAAFNNDVSHLGHICYAMSFTYSTYTNESMINIYGRPDGTNEVAYTFISTNGIEGDYIFAADFSAPYTWDGQIGSVSITPFTEYEFTIDDPPVPDGSTTNWISFDIEKEVCVPDTEWLDDLGYQQVSIENLDFNCYAIILGDTYYTEETNTAIYSYTTNWYSQTGWFYSNIVYNLDSNTTHLVTNEIPYMQLHEEYVVVYAEEYQYAVTNATGTAYYHQEKDTPPFKATEKYIRMITPLMKWDFQYCTGD